MRFASVVLLVPLLLLHAGPSAAQNGEEEVPTILIEGGGLDIFGGAVGPEGRIFRGRPAADFPLLFALEKDFVGEIAADAERPEVQ